MRTISIIAIIIRTSFSPLANLFETLLQEGLKGNNLKIKIMSWDKVESNCKALYEYQFINGKKPTERRVLIQVIAEEFPELTRVRIAYAVDRCITTVAAPMSPSTFLAFVQGYLK